ncbi:MAG: MFS transporter [Chloroflexi bacterium]|nr:MFS transporter [Chloroflexota bacterium]
MSRLGTAFRPLIARQFGSLAIFNYRVYFLGQTVSLIGTWMQTTGQAWLVLRLTGSPLALGTVTTLQFLPITVFTLFGGVVADRLPKRRMLMVTQSAALAQALVLGILVASGQVELWHVYVLALLLGTINALDGPVRQSFAVELVGKDQLANAVALNSSIFNVARILGPGVGGLAIAWVGLSTTFFLNAASFVAVIGAYAIMRPSEFNSPHRRAAQGNVLRQIGEGIAYSVRTPAVLFVFILLAFIGTFGFNFTVVIPLVAEFALKVGPSKFGLLTSAMGAGSLVGALAIAAFGKASTKVLLLDCVGFVLLFAAIALSTSYPLTAALFVLLGGTSVIFSTTINTSLQLTVPDHLRGRVMSIFFLLFAGSTPVGGYLTGFLGEKYGVRPTLAAEAIISGVGIVVALAYAGRFVVFPGAGRRAEQRAAEAAAAVEPRDGVARDHV